MQELSFPYGASCFLFISLLFVFCQMQIKANGISVKKATFWWALQPAFAVNSEVFIPWSDFYYGEIILWCFPAQPPPAHVSLGVPGCRADLSLLASHARHGSCISWTCQLGCAKPSPKTGWREAWLLYPPIIALMLLARLSSTTAKMVFSFSVFLAIKGGFCFFPAELWLATTEGFQVTQLQWWVLGTCFRQRSLCLSSAFSIN